jgi:hypothetical protein
VEQIDAAPRNSVGNCRFDPIGEDMTKAPVFRFVQRTRKREISAWVAFSGPLSVWGNRAG